VHERQYLTGSHNDIIIHIAAINDRHAARIDVKPLAEPPADFANGQVADGQTLGVRSGRDGH
jgi:hypothetical protein